MENIQWLTENGGPAIKLNMINEGLIDKNAYDVDELVDELLQIEKVKTALTYFDKFKDYESMPLNYLQGYIHSCYEDCYEMFMPFFIRLGFRTGIPIFDEKVEIMREVYNHIRTQGKPYWEDYWGFVVIPMLEAGYYHDEMLDVVKGFLDRIYNFVKLEIFDIYETDPSEAKAYSTEAIGKRPDTKGYERIRRC